MSVREAVERDLAKLPDDLADSGLAATALAMADRIDGGKGSPSECAKALMQALEQLRDLAPAPEKEKDGLDDLSARRAARLAGKPGAKAKRGS